MATSLLLPVYPAEEVAELFKLRISQSVLDSFKTPPEPSPRHIGAWHPGLPLREQAELPLVRGRNLLCVRQDLRSRKFATVPVQAGYYPICMPAPDTGRLSIAEQESVVAQFGEVACPAPIGTWNWLVHFLATGESLGLGLWMRCQEETSPVSHVELIAYASKLYVHDGRDRGVSHGIQLASLGLPGEGNLVS